MVRSDGLKAVFVFFFCRNISQNKHLLTHPVSSFPKRCCFRGRCSSDLCFKTKQNLWFELLQLHEHCSLSCYRNCSKSLLLRWMLGSLSQVQNYCPLWVSSSGVPNISGHLQQRGWEREMCMYCQDLGEQKSAQVLRGMCKTVLLTVCKTVCVRWDILLTFVGKNNCISVCCPVKKRWQMIFVL